MESKIVEYREITGWITEVLPLLKRSVTMFEKHYKSVYVGITGRNPQARFNEHCRKENWERMIVKYKTTSEAFVNQIENYFIITHPQLKNKWLGKSNLAKNKYNYFYILVKDRKD